jgi:hypothetical protein
MLADASISRACISKAKPQHAVWPTIRARAHRPGAAWGGGKRRRRDIPVGLASWYDWDPDRGATRRAWRRGRRGRVPRRGEGGECDNPPRKIPYYRLNQSTLVIKQ